MEVFGNQEISQRIMENNSVFLLRTHVKKVGTLTFCDKIHSPEDVADMVKDLIMGETKENLLALYLISNRVVGVERVSVGSVRNCGIPVRDIFQSCFLCNADGIILVHNHISGNLTPSESDIVATKRMVKSADILGIKFLDHIIMRGLEDGFVSLRNLGHI